ncbi:hypothetical protein F5Y17DRAFT_393943 [Xylariaceae sp. FL0594]|nr:hypothetical protein F5Y17DRAFT_393943 [Xylariaceae sp. FL0594]
MASNILSTAEAIPRWSDEESRQHGDEDRNGGLHDHAGKNAHSGHSGDSGTDSTSLSGFFLARLGVQRISSKNSGHSNESPGVKDGSPSSTKGSGEGHDDDRGQGDGSYSGHGEGPIDPSSDTTMVSRTESDLPITLANGDDGNPTMTDELITTLTTEYPSTTGDGQAGSLLPWPTASFFTSVRQSSSTYVSIEPSSTAFNTPQTMTPPDTSVPPITNITSLPTSTGSPNAGSAESSDRPMSMSTVTGIVFGGVIGGITAMSVLVLAVWATRQRWRAAAATTTTAAHTQENPNRRCYWEILKGLAARTKRKLKRKRDTQIEYRKPELDADNNAVGQHPGGPHELGVPRPGHDFPVEMNSEREPAELAADNRPRAGAGAKRTWRTRWVA